MDTGHDATKDVEQADAANAEMVAVASVEEAKPAEASPAASAAAAAPAVVPDVRLDSIPDPVQPSIAAAVSASARSFATRARRLTPIAATIALSAALGGIVGSMAATGFVHVAAPAPAVARSDDTSRATIARIVADLFALKSGMEASSKAANTHFAKIAERLDRGERAQIDPTLKLAKIAEGIDRIERRATPAPAPAPAAAVQPNHDTTGSIANPAARPGPTILDSWRLRRVRYGAAIIEGKLGAVEVEPGDTIPGLGRIENIKRQDGRWVVVTSRGLIVDR